MRRSNSAEDFDAGGGVEVTRRLVGEEDIRLIDKGPGDGHTLLLAAGKLIGSVQRSIHKADQVKHCHGLLTSFAGRDTAVDQRQLDILDSTLPFEKIETLEDKAELAIAQVSELRLVEPANVLPIQAIRAARGPIQTTQNVHECRFPRTARPANGHKFAGMNRQRYPT